MLSHTTATKGDEIAVFADFLLFCDQFPVELLGGAAGL